MPIKPGRIDCGASQLHICDLPLSFEAAVCKTSREEKSIRDASCRKIISSSGKKVVVEEGVLPTPASCFVAGTLVHTDKGLVPIQILKVGDRVLARPGAEGDQAFKPVARTFSIPDKEIYLLRLYKDSPSNGLEQLGVTANHPFRALNAGWRRVDRLHCGDAVELCDGSAATVLCSVPLQRTGVPGTAWAVAAWGLESNDGAGKLVHFHAGGPIDVDLENVFNWEVLFDETQSSRFHQVVYSIEVEDFHTYYVGECGAWVHDTSPGDEASDTD